MNIILRILQVPLAALFLWHGWLFLAPPAELVDSMNSRFPRRFLLFPGIAEVLATIGLTLPGITRVLPRLIDVTSVCLMFVMVCATVVHSSRSETGSAVTTASLFVVLGFVAYMRWKVKPIAEKGEAR